LKQAAKAAEIEAAAADVDATAEPPAATAPIDPASLPSLESIAADSDIIAFLRAGVPAELTRAALRKAWTSDPAIRDFIGIAENQWDFNDPNAIPGFGPLQPAEGGVDVFAQISTRLERLPGELQDLAVTAAPPPSNTDEQSLDGRITSDTSLPANPGAIAHDIEAVGEIQDTPATGTSGKRRPHGSALPVSRSIKPD
jgi:hypothetical protein